MPMRRRLSWFAIAFAIVSTYLLWFYASRLHTSEERARQLIEATPVGIVVCDTAGAVVTVNEAVCTITGFTADEILRGGVTTIIPEEYRNAHRDGFAKFVRGLTNTTDSPTTYKKVFPVLCKDGTLIRATVVCSAVPGDDGYELFAFITPVLPPTDDATRNFPGPYKN